MCSKSHPVRRQIWAQPVTAFVASVVAIGCGHECHEIIEGTQQALSEPAPADGWHMPEDVAEIAASMSLAYVGAPSWDDGANCSGGMREGSRTVSEYIQQHFAGVDYIGGYNCRQIRNSTSMSVHGTGRAIDIMIPVLADGGANNAVGDPIANWLTVNAERLGIHLIIWDQASWGPHRDHRNTALYDNPGYPHKNHLHVELTDTAASETSDWFKDGGLFESPLTSPYHAQFIKTDDSDALGTMVEGRAGEVVTVSYAFENVGSEPWLPGEVQLAIVSPERDAAAPQFKAPTWLSDSRPATVAQSTEAGQVGVFTFEITVPAEPGVHDLYLALVRDGEENETWLKGIGGAYDHRGVYVLVNSLDGSGSGSETGETDPDAGLNSDYGGDLKGCSVGSQMHSGWFGVLIVALGLFRRRRSQC